MMTTLRLLNLITDAMRSRKPSTLALVKAACATAAGLAALGLAAILPSFYPISQLLTIGAIVVIWTGVGPVVLPVVDTILESVASALLRWHAARSMKKAGSVEPSGDVNTR